MEKVAPDGLPEKVFNSRNEAEIDILYDKGVDVKLDGSWKGKQIIHVPRWNLRKAHSCGKYVAQIIMDLFPNDVLFLVQINFDDKATAAEKLYDILFNRCYDQACRVVMITLGINDETEALEFIESLMPEDLMELFTVIIEQEINNKRTEAILKKVQRLLVEKFRLENESFDLQSIADLLLTRSSTVSPLSNLSSTPSMQTPNQPKTITDNSPRTPAKRADES